MRTNETARASQEQEAEIQRSLENAQQAFEEGEFEESLRRLSFAFLIDPEHLPLYDLAILSLGKLGAVRERKLFEWAVDHFDDFEPFFRLGYHFIEKDDMRMAVPFLSIAHDRNPEDLDIAVEYSLALTGQFQIRRALEVLTSVNYQKDFWATYQYHFCRLLDNQRMGIKSFVTRVRRDLRHIPHSARHAISYVIKKLDEMHGRLQRLDRPRRRIRDWHFVQYGSAILSTMGGITENTFAGGRYGHHRETLAGIREVLERLCRFLVELDRVPDEIVSLSDRDSRILAIVLGKMLRRPIYPVEAANPDRPNVLLVASDARLLENMPELEQARPNQTIFACNLHWLGDGDVTPDVSGFLTQTFTFPWWDGGYERDARVGRYVSTGPDVREEDEIAASILEEFPTEPEMIPEFIMPFRNSEEPMHTDDFLHALSFYRKVGDMLKGAPGNPQKKSMRWPFRVESPVPGSYYC